MLRLLALVAFLVLPFLAWPEPARGATAQDVAALEQELHQKRDDVSEEVLEQLAQMDTREALDALIKGYDLMASVYMRRAIVRLLPQFDGVGEAEQPALQKLMDVATDSPDRELRQAAVEALVRCRNLGKGFLALIVDSRAMGEIREQAMQEHVRMGGEEDVAWYRQLFERTAEKEREEAKEADKGKRKRKKDEAEPAAAPRVNQTIRRMAFERVAEQVEIEKLVEAAERDDDPGIRGRALHELQRRGDRKVEQIAADRFKRVDEIPAVRIAAAEVLGELRGEKAVDDFLDMSSKVTTPDVLRTRMAELSAEFASQSDKASKLLVRRLGKGKWEEKRFVMLATRRIEDEKVTKNLRKSLDDKDQRIQLLALELIAERGDREAEPLIRELMEDEGDERKILEGSFAALSTLKAGDPKWKEELDTYVASTNRDVRNAALAQLGQQDLGVLIEHLRHDDWSTRLAALRRLEKLRQKEAVEPIIERMGEEIGRMLHEFADTLWALTGQPFRTRTSQWQAWWAAEGADFEVISESELTRLASEEEERRLKQTTSVPQFFGIRIVSERVIFVLDISGSMAWEIGGQDSSWGDPIRMDVAKRELVKTLKSLEEGALFNLIVFSSDVNSWLDDGVIGSEARTREEAIEYVERLGAGGGTNIFGALRAAFEDPDVDTIVFLSDGEPTVGAVQDPQLIREEVAAWNENRGIVIHTIAVGIDLDVLEWIAEDSGGQHVRYE